MFFSTAEIYQRIQISKEILEPKCIDPNLKKGFFIPGNLAGNGHSNDFFFFKSQTSVFC